MENEQIQCSKCKQTKPTADFHKCKPSPAARTTNSKRYGRASMCKACMSEYNKHHSRKKLYGLTKEESLRLEARANGRCEVCSKEQTHMSMGKVVSLCVDHCHKTGRVRGLLCTNCNKILGMVGEDIDYLKKIVSGIEAYLTTHKQ